MFIVRVKSSPRRRNCWPRCESWTNKNLTIMTREEEIEKAARSAFPYKGEDDMRAAYIRGAKWALKRSPWISVSERLPEAYKSVIACYKVDIAGSYTEYDYSTAFLTDDGAWVAYQYNDANAHIGHRVVAWMPIPPLPEKGGGE